MLVSLFFFNDTATTEIYTLSLHDALPISAAERALNDPHPGGAMSIRRNRARRVARIWARGAAAFSAAMLVATFWANSRGEVSPDRKSTRLNSSHANISYAVFCLKKKKHKL